jgi:RNA polymerase sigma-70 factor (ECF subfamily)
MMSEYSEQLAGTSFMALDQDQGFEAQLADSTRLAFRVAYGVLRHREDAEDVAQEALTKAYRKLGSLRERERFRAWLVRITWRLAIDHQRVQKRRGFLGSVDEINPAEKETPADMLASRERSASLWRAIDALPEKLRIVTVLAGIQEHDIREVALLLNLPEGTIKSRLFLARQKLKELMQ